MNTMKFPPKSREEAMTVGLLEKGEYSFEIKKATLKTSDSGNPYLFLVLNAWNDKGEQGILFDNLSYNESFEFKLRHFCYAIECGFMSEKGEIDADAILNKQGRCRIGIKEDKTGQYPPKNVVLDYTVINKIFSKDKNELNDELSF